MHMWQKCINNAFHTLFPNPRQQPRTSYSLTTSIFLPRDISFLSLVTGTLLVLWGTFLRFVTGTFLKNYHWY